MKIITSPLTFKYQVIDGISEKSYALEIAKLAGMPYQIIEKAEKILKNN